MLGNLKTKAEYSEDEAARKLGLSLEQLRSLVRNHLVRDDEASSDMPVFQPSDLVLLRILSSMRPNSAS